MSEEGYRRRSSLPPMRTEGTWQKVNRWLQQSEYYGYGVEESVPEEEEEEVVVLKVFPVGKHKLNPRKDRGSNLTSRELPATGSLEKNSDLNKASKNK